MDSATSSMGMVLDLLVVMRLLLCFMPTETVNRPWSPGPCGSMTICDWQ